MDFRVRFCPPLPQTKRCVRISQSCGSTTVTRVFCRTPHEDNNFEHGMFIGSGIKDQVRLTPCAPAVSLPDSQIPPPNGWRGLHRAAASWSTAPRSPQEVGTVRITMSAPVWVALKQTHQQNNVH